MYVYHCFLLCYNDDYDATLVQLNFYPQPGQNVSCTFLYSGQWKLD